MEDVKGSDLVRNLNLFLLPNSCLFRRKFLKTTILQTSHRIVAVRSMLSLIDSPKSITPR